MTENTDEKILEKAKEIQAESGGSLMDAMLKAEAQLAPKPTVPTEFTVTIPVKPRVARWLIEEFSPTAEFSTEDRLAAYLATVLNRSRIQAMRAGQDAPDIQKGQAVTMTRDQFKSKAPDA